MRCAAALAPSLAAADAATILHVARHVEDQRGDDEAERRCSVAQKCKARAWMHMKVELRCVTATRMSMPRTAGAPAMVHAPTTGDWYLF